MAKCLHVSVASLLMLMLMLAAASAATAAADALAAVQFETDTSQYIIAHNNIEHCIHIGGITITILNFKFMQFFTIIAADACTRRCKTSIGHMLIYTRT